MSTDRVSSARRHQRGLLRDLGWRLTRLFNRTSFDPLSDEGPGGQADRAWRPCIKQRSFLLLAALTLWTTAIEARLVWLQVVRHEDFVAQANKQQEGEIALEAVRGQIVDRHGRLLAFSVEADSIEADPSIIKPARRAEIVRALCDALGDCTPKFRAELLEKFSGDGQWASVRKSRTLSPEQVNRVKALHLPGIRFEPGTRRYYPKFEVAAHVLGFVGAENKGQAGVELAHESEVRGKEGTAIAQVDGKHLLRTRVEVPPVPGASLELTIDLNLQYIADRELRAGVEANRADAGVAIIMDPNTGEVLALASYPTFNPNVGPTSEAAWINRAVQIPYEPGSTFKIVTASAALDEGVVSATDLIETSPGYITFPGRRTPIREAKGHNYGLLSFEDVIVKSSNVGAVKIGLSVGRERLTRYVERFGFGQKLTPDLTGESRGQWNPAALNPSGLASVSMGYQISVTPIQMAAAVSSVANGGTLFEPHLVRAIVRDGHREPVAPKALRRTISATTAATLTTMMEGVVERGTATAAQLDGYPVAGKTGTAAKAATAPARGYSTTDYHASFVGFVPSRQPVFTILVVIDTPRAGTSYGGTVAAPIFKRIAAAALQQAGVPSRINPIPPVIVQPRVELPRRARAALPLMVQAGGPALMPDVRGLAAREAMRVFADIGLTPSMTGSGVVVRQSPEPGAPLPGGGQGLLVLGRRRADVAAVSGGAW